MASRRRTLPLYIVDISFFEPFFSWLSEHPALSGLMVFLIAMAESLLIVGLVVPGTVLMFGVGALVGAGVLNVWETILWAFVGAAVGDAVSFWIGFHYKHYLQRLWPLSRYPHMLQQGTTFFKKHGGKSVLFGRFVGPVRPIIPAVAGMMGMDPRRFFLVNVLSAAIWAPAYLMPGMVFGASFELASEVAGRLAILIVLLVAVGYVIFWFLKKFYDFWLPFYLKGLKSIETNTRYVSLLVILQFVKKARSIPSSLYLLFLVSVILGSTLFFGVLTYEDNSRALATVKQPLITKADWLGDDWQKFAAYYPGGFIFDDLPFNAQFYSTPSSLYRFLEQSGWQRIAPLTLKSALYFLKAEPRLDELPVFSLAFMHNGEYHNEMWVKVMDDHERVVLRVWHQLDASENGQAILWLANVNMQQTKSWFNWVTTISESLGFDAALQQLTESAQLDGVAYYLHNRPLSASPERVNVPWDGRTILIAIP